MTELNALLPALSRAPDFDAPDLRAYDATDLLLLDTAADWLGAGQELAPRDLITIGDRHGALTLGAMVRLGATNVRVFQDPLLQERALAANARRVGLSGGVDARALGPELLAGARVVLLQLPRELSALAEIAERVARHAAPDVVVFAGGRVKHMTRAMNTVLLRNFTHVVAGLASRKSRILTVRGPRPRSALGNAIEPAWGADRDIDFLIAAYGATFGGATLDHGSRLLLRTFRDSGWPAAQRVVDLGCGNGVLATAAARALPAARIVATDQSASAVRSTRRTAEAAGVADRVQVHRADGCEAVPDGWADLLLLNPPFHSGPIVHAGIAHRLIESAAGALRPGGELRLVFNSALGYRSLVERVVGPARQLARTRTFTVLAARRRDA